MPEQITGTKTRGLFAPPLSFCDRVLRTSGMAPALNGPHRAGHVVATAPWQINPPDRREAQLPERGRESAAAQPRERVQRQ